MSRHSAILLILFALGLSACSTADQSTAVTPLVLPPTPDPTFTPRPTPVPTATPWTCLSQPPRVDQGVVDTTVPPDPYLIYLPPCYDMQPDQRYPVLYLLHGQTYIDDQWVRLGVPQAANRMILSGASPAFIIVFPDDRYWNSQAGPGFGSRLISGIIPYIDAHYRTLNDREHRALGGLSRGGGWALHLGLTHYDMFGTIGLHSPAVFVDDAQYLERWIRAIPANEWPRLWIDAGDRDSELGSILRLENLLIKYQIPHEWHMYTGDHTENYWGAHVTEYLQWYAAGWKPQSGTGD